MSHTRPDIVLCSFDLLRVRITHVFGLGRLHEQSNRVFNVVTHAVLVNQARQKKKKTNGIRDSYPITTHFWSHFKYVVISDSSTTIPQWPLIDPFVLNSS